MGLILQLLLGIIKISLRIFSELLIFPRSTSELTLKVISGPFDTMVNKVREVSQGTHGDTVLFRILRVAVRLGLTRDNALRVTLSTQSTRFEQVLIVEDTSVIDVKSGLDVINGVDNSIQALPEVISELVVIVWGNSGLKSFNLKVRVHLLGFSAGTFRFRLLDIGSSEQELSVEIGDLNSIIISTNNFTMLTSGEARKGKLLKIFTAQSTSTDQEELLVGEFILEFVTKDGDLIIISGSLELSGDVGSRSNFELVKVEPLSQRHVFTSVLEDFLGNNTTPEGSVR